MASEEIAPASDGGARVIAFKRRGQPTVKEAGLSQERDVALQRVEAFKGWVSVVRWRSWLTGASAALLAASPFLRLGAFQRLGVATAAVVAWAFFAWWTSKAVRDGELGDG